MMQLDKLDMSDPKTVAAVVAIGALGLGMCVQLVFLFATLFRSDKKPASARKRGRPRKYPENSQDRAVSETKKKTPTKHQTPVKNKTPVKSPASAKKSPAPVPPKTPKTAKKTAAGTSADDLMSPIRRSSRLATQTQTPGKKSN
mmetsp:Transcript_19995/g.49655  ORF Transcript_19995/g.49655 Transcript_19995/m.49655 type:complete len:144 (-) Transcript_19995:741-1172(-)